MGVLAAVNYEPATLQSKATDTLLAMTALDAAAGHLRLPAFIAPANGIVQARLRASIIGATTFPRILLGVMDGATVRMRMSPMGGRVQSLTTTLLAQEALGLITGLTPGNSYTFDAAYGVEVVVASTNIKYGGPDDALGGDAAGGFAFEIWDTANLLAGTLYDPAAAVTKSMTALLALTELDTTNLRLAFTAPASGAAYWRLRGQSHGSTTAGQVLLGIKETGAKVASVAPIHSASDTFAASSCVTWEAEGIVTGLTPGSSHTWDAAYAVQTVAGAGGLKYGGPNDATTNNAFGGFAFEIWAA